MTVPKEAAILKPMSNFTRRDLLLAGGAMALAPTVARAERWLAADGSFSFSYFSDTHVALKGNIPENAAMLAEIRKLPIDFAINGGDVTDYGWVKEYENYWNLIKDLPFPVHHVPGNHDVRWSPLGPKAYREGTRDPMFSAFDHKGVHFALLDSTVPLSHYGHFESAMLRWLEADLKKVGRERPVFVITHHWVGRDKAMIDNEAALLKIIAPYNVKLVLNGHGHSDLLWTWDGIPNTMNKGLYQGSWQRIDVDREKGEVRLARSTKERPELGSLLTVPLAAPRDRQPLWAIPAELRAGAVLTPAVPKAREYRWDDGEWKAIPVAGIPADLTGGTHTLALRADDRTFFYAGETRVTASSGALRPRWERKLPGGVMSHLRLHDGVLYVSCMDGSLVAIDKRDGKVRWTAKTGDYCHSSPTVSGDAVLVGSADGGMYAFDRRSGKRRWRFATDGPVYASAAVAGDLAVFGSGDGKVYGVDLKSGRERWRYAFPAGNTSFVQSPAATDGERFYLGAWDKHLYAFDRGGKLLWRRDCVGERSWAYSPAIGGPAVSASLVVVPANGNNLCAFDPRTGEPLWNVSSPGDKYGYSSPAIVGDRIVIGCLGGKGEIRCVGAKDGAILWTAETGSTIYDSSPSEAAGVVAVGSVSGLLSAISLADGKILGGYRLPTGHLLASPVSEPGAVYAASYSDVVAAFDVRL
ncbi:MAG: PQQ-binding-like beta-propeller repeat protein [Fimbriimonas sp.]